MFGIILFQMAITVSIFVVTRFTAIGQSLIAAALGYEGVLSIAALVLFVLMGLMYFVKYKQPYNVILLCVFVSLSPQPHVPKPPTLISI